MTKASKIISVVLSLLFTMSVAFLLLPKVITYASLLIVAKTLFLVSPQLSLTGDQLTALQTFMTTAFPWHVMLCTGVGAVALYLLIQTSIKLYSSMQNLTKTA